jgi:hypothetical protein
VYPEEKVIPGRAGVLLQALGADADVGAHPDFGVVVLGVWYLVHGEITTNFPPCHHEEAIGRRGDLALATVQQRRSSIAVVPGVEIAASLRSSQ